MLFCINMNSIYNFNMIKLPLSDRKHIIEPQVQRSTFTKEKKIKAKN